MANMFMNYQNPSSQSPNNLYKAFPQVENVSKLYATEASKPYELLNFKGELEGYYWNYGDSINLEFNIDGEITVESNAIVLKHYGQDPNVMQTPGKVGQRCYNIMDLRSWSCRAIIKHEFIWEEDPEFTYMLGGDRNIYVSASDYIKDKLAIIKLYNFDFEEIYSEEIPANMQVRLVITPELSKTLYKGIYYCSLEIAGNDSHQTIFAAQDCKLIVR